MLIEPLENLAIHLFLEFRQTVVAAFKEDEATGMFGSGQQRLHSLRIRWVTSLISAAL